MAESNRHCCAAFPTKVRTLRAACGETGVCLRSILRWGPQIFGRPTNPQTTSSRLFVKRVETDWPPGDFDE